MDLIYPYLALVVAASVILVAKFRTGPKGFAEAGPIAAVGAALAFGLCILQWGKAATPTTGFHGFLLIDRLGVLASALACLAGAVTAVLLPHHLQRAGKDRAEVYVLLLLVIAGMMAMVQTDHLVGAFVGLETLSVGLYALSAALRERRASVEAGLKYFLTGAFASGILVFGLALVYGAAGSFSLPVIEAKLVESSGLALAGILLLLVGFGFKLSAVPFHMWAPDVYEGAPTPITGFMSTAVKVVAATALLRVLDATPAFSGQIVEAVGWLAVLTVTVGNLSALAQHSVKRMLAYSSIGHAGYLFLAFAAFLATPDTAGFSAPLAAVMQYLAAYTITNLGAFAVLSALETADGRGLTFADLGGLKSRSPVLAFTLLIMMLSLASVPLTVGFLAKWNVFAVLVERARSSEGPFFWVLLAALILNSVVGLAYYLRVISAMYMRPAPEPLPATSPVSKMVMAVCILLVIAVVWLGAGPNVLGMGADGLFSIARAAAG